MTTWLIHRISGLIMIGLFALKFVTAFYLLPDDKPAWAVVIVGGGLAGLRAAIALNGFRAFIPGPGRHGNRRIHGHTVG